jgi:hypothetical protein
MPRPYSRRVCHWCEAPLDGGNRKYCSDDCRLQAQEKDRWNPTPDEIRAICRQIQREGGEQWKRNRTCYPPQPVTPPVVSVAACDFW